MYNMSVGVQKLPDKWPEASPLLSEKMHTFSRDIDKMYDSLVLKYKEGIERVNENIIEQEERHQRMNDGLHKKVDKGFASLSKEIAKLTLMSRSNKDELAKYTSERKFAKTVANACIYAIPQIFIAGLTFITFYFTTIKPIIESKGH